MKRTLAAFRWALILKNPTVLILGKGKSAPNSIVNLSLKHGFFLSLSLFFKAQESLPTLNGSDLLVVRHNEPKRTFSSTLYEPDLFAVGHNEFMRTFTSTLNVPDLLAVGYNELKRTFTCIYTEQTFSVGDRTQ